MLLEINKKLPKGNNPAFLMPLSLRLIKEASENYIDWKSLHIIDLFSILFSIRITNAEKYLEIQRKNQLSQKGISEIRKATEEDFDNL